MKDIHDASLKAPILIVDDNPANVLLLERILGEGGYRNVHTTTDPKEVVQLNNRRRFDIVLLDIRMPEMDGFQVLEALTDPIRDDLLPVLVLSADLDPATRLKALELGAKDFIAKPFERSEVLTRVRNLLEVRILYNRHRWQSDILEAKVRERTDQLYRTQLEIVRRLGRAGEYRDNETGMHVIRMSKSCQALGLATGLSAGRCELLLHTSPLHDVGKIGIPDRILLKPGKLTAEEWKVMKTHVDIGASILTDHGSEIIRMARIVVLTHHEKWDGSGYPKGLKAEDIPIEGRIAALCDVFDALTSERPYKRAWSVEEALAYVDGNAGLHFEPRLVTVFKEILPEILVIRQRFSDEAPLPPEDIANVA